MSNRTASCLNSWISLNAIFPYIEKLMPTIKFLRETLYFDDAVIRKLCTFKDASIKGELYSREFNQRFKADGAVCSLNRIRRENLISI